MVSSTIFPTQGADRDETEGSQVERHLSASTLKLYVAAIAVNHNTIDGRSVEKNNLVIRFLRDAQRLKAFKTAPHPLLGSLSGLTGPSERSI